MTTSTYGGYCLLVNLANDPTIMKIVDELRPALESIGAEFVNPNSYHLTICGTDTNSADTSVLGNKLPFDKLGFFANLSGLQVFNQDDGRTQVICLLLANSPEVSSLQRASYNVLRQNSLVPNSFSEPRDYIPHIAIAYADKIPNGLSYTPTDIIISNMQLNDPSGNVVVESGEYPYRPNLPEDIADRWQSVYNETYAQTNNIEASRLAADGSINKGYIVGFKATSGGPTIAGWGLLFTDPENLDLQSTYFDPETSLLIDYYHDAPLFYEHGQDAIYGVTPIGKRKLVQVFPRGVWVEHVLDTTHPLFQKTKREAEQGLLAYSSDSISHLVEKGYDPKDGALMNWPLAGWSVTSDPAEPALGPVVYKEFIQALKKGASKLRKDWGRKDNWNTPIDAGGPSNEDLDFMEAFESNLAPAYVAPTVTDIQRRLGLSFPSTPSEAMNNMAAVSSYIDELLSDVDGAMSEGVQTLSDLPSSYSELLWFTDLFWFKQLNPSLPQLVQMLEEVKADMQQAVEDVMQNDKARVVKAKTVNKYSPRAMFVKGKSLRLNSKKAVSLTDIAKQEARKQQLRLRKAADTDAEPDLNDPNETAEIAAEVYNPTVEEMAAALGYDVSDITGMVGELKNIQQRLSDGIEPDSKTYELFDIDPSDLTASMDLSEAVDKAISMLMPDSPATASRDDGTDSYESESISMTPPSDQMSRRRAGTINTPARNRVGQRDIPAQRSNAPAAVKRNIPYGVQNKPAERQYGGFNINRGVPEPGVYDVFRDLVMIRAGMQPRTYKSAKAMSYSTGPSGGYVLNQVISDTILDPLRANSVLLSLGARQEDLDGIQVKQVPAMQSAPSAYWPGEGQAVTGSQPQYRMITLVPKPLAVLVQRPFNFFKNMSPRAEEQLRTQIHKSLTLEIDRVGMLGTGGAIDASTNTGAQPVGLLNMSGVTKTSLATNGRTPTIDDLIQADGRLDDANIPEEGMRGWAMHSRTKRTFTGMTDALGQPLFRESWGNAAVRTLIDYPYAVSTQIPTNVTTGTNSDTSYIFFGDWQYMVIGMTTTVELVLDQTYAANLLQGLLAYVYIDVQVEYTPAFQILTGVRA